MKLKIGKDFIFYFSGVLLFFIALDYKQFGIFALFALMVITVIKEIKRSRALRVDGEFIVLFLANLLYVILYKLYVPLGIYTIILYFFGPIVSYLVGVWMTEGDENKLKIIAITIAVGMMTHAVLNLTVSNILEGISERYVNEFWSGNIISATLQGTFFSFGIGSLYYILRHKNMVFKLFGVVGIVCIIWNSFLTAGRTPAFLLILEIVVLSFYESYINNDRNRMKRVFLNLVRGIFIFVILISLYNINIFGVKNLYHESSLYLRFKTMNSITEDTRIDHLIGVLQNLIQHPLGNIDSYTDEVSYAHNFWFDIGRQTGVVPMLLYIMFTVIAIKKYRSIISENRIKKQTRILITGIYFSVGVFCMLEPIMEGNPWLFFMMCMICGGVHSIKIRRNISENFMDV